eukprot:gene3564-biopygen6199
MWGGAKCRTCNHTRPSAPSHSNRDAEAANVAASAPPPRHSAKSAEQNTTCARGRRPGHRRFSNSTLTAAPVARAARIISAVHSSGLRPSMCTHAGRRARSAAAKAAVESSGTLDRSSVSPVPPRRA